jgi:mannose/fructose-specific phosphotransferase system component IIA
MHALVEKISQACEDVDQGVGVLLLVDVHGSTPFHAAMTMLDGTRPAEVLCGVNLPMLIKLTNLDRTQGPPVVLAEELRDAGRRSIRLGSELTGKVGVEERR